MKMMLLLLAVFAASQALPNPQNLTETSPGGSLTSRLEFPTLPKGINPTASAENCMCVPLYQCNDPAISEDGETLIDARFGGPCEDSNNVCCKRSYVTPNAPLPLPTTDVCGLSKNNDQWNKIAPARAGEAEFAEFPWMAAILQSEELSFQCGGSLIHPQVVLTAAHCVGNSTDFTVRLGEWNSQMEEEPLLHQDKKVIKTVCHPEFTMPNLRHDLSLLFLDSPVNFTSNIGRICLPKSNDVFDGSRCFVAGWGKDSYGKEGVYRAILKKIEMPIVNRNTCQNNLRQTRLSNVFKLHSSFMCAGGEVGKDACMGDGGGPLMCPHPQYPTYYTQAGIVSWGIGCGDQNVPGVYSNVAYDREWIDRQLSENLNHN